MILKAEALSLEQKSAIEEILGRQILEAEAVSLRAFEPPKLDLPRRQAALGKLREFLEETGRPHTNLSDEECETALLEAIRNERPRYAQMP